MVAPVRWATPGTEVDCATQPWLSASATIQSTSTPPPWPPMASTAIESGLVGSIGIMFIAAASRGHDAAPVAPVLQIADHGGAQRRQQAIEPRRVVDDVGAVERRAQHGGLGNLAAIAAADTGIVDSGDGVVLQRITGVLDRQRRAAG